MTWGQAEILRFAQNDISPVSENLTDRRLANIGANAIYDAFDYYQTQFNLITRRAQTRFETRDWHGEQSDSLERLNLYKAVVDPGVTEIRGLLKDRVYEKTIWAAMKQVYSGLIMDREEWELAETFFNSVTRRIFSTTGVDPNFEFVDTDFDTPPTQARHPIYRTYERVSPAAPDHATAALIETILTDYSFRVEYQDLARDAELVAEEIGRYFGSDGIERAELARHVFYRGNGAYIVGRICCDGIFHPLVIALLNTAQGIVVDAVLLTEDEVSILFSFTRSYFHVHARRPYDLVHFLKQIMPRKRIAELYISIGHNKHGKTELYRDLRRHLAGSTDKFEIAPGARGMVMTVFTMPSYDVVFKIIKDRFDEPKNSTRQEVMEKYQLVFKHDRAGRLVDAQEFEHLEFDRERFTDELLAELQRVAADSVHADAEHVVIKHLYAERRMTPLNLYVRGTDETAITAAVIDYGSLFKDLAAANIFPGDMLLKNFGVTRHGRVVFYDYDELALVTECRFRTVPPPRDDQEELSAEPWYYVAENDFFPEEFSRWLGLEPRWREVFLSQHADLFDVDFWRDTQARILAGEVIHIFPYPQNKHLSDEWKT